MVSGDRVILHCDMNSFYASVELLDYPELKSLPVAVSGSVDNRHGIILARNEAAKKYGVKTAETVWQARRKCPSLKLLRPHFEKYEHYYKLINRIYQSYTDLVEPFSIDESWLDVTGSLKLFKMNGREMADDIRRRVRKETGLTLSVGVSFNKIFAKMGSDYKKPDATTVINRDNYKDLLWPMDVGKLFFVGAATAQKLRSIGVNTIGDLASRERRALVSVLGKTGGQLHDYACGGDSDPVAPYTQRREPKSVGNGITFKRDLVGREDIRTAVTALSDKVAGRLRRYGLFCTGVKIDIKSPSFRVISRQKQLGAASCLASEISEACMELIDSNWDVKEPIRLITVTAISLTREEGGEQIGMFSMDPEEREKFLSMEKAVDKIRDKYGGGAIIHGGVLGNDMGIEEW